MYLRPNPYLIPVFTSCPTKNALDILLKQQFFTSNLHRVYLKYEKMSSKPHSSYNDETKEEDVITSVDL